MGSLGASCGASCGVRTRAGRGGAAARVGQRNGGDRPAQWPSALPLQNETAPDRLVRSPRLVQGRSMEPSREVEAWVESYFCSSVLLALAA